MFRLVIILLSVVSLRLVADESVDIAYPPFAPFYSYEDGQHTGICPDTVNKIFSDSHSFDFQVKTLPLPRIMRDLVSGELDMAGCLPCSSEDVQQHVTFTIPYFEENMLMVFPADSELASIDSEQRMNYQGATARAAITERYINPEKKNVVDSWTSLIQFIQKERANYAVIPESIMNDLKTRSEINLDNLISRRIDTISVCMAVSNKSELGEHVDSINQKIKLLPHVQEWIQHEEKIPH